MKNDSRKRSLIESLFDIITGFLIYLPINYFVLPYFTEVIDNQNIETMLTISLIYTSIALVRKYLIRRAFVSKTVTKKLQNLTKFIK